MLVRECELTVMSSEVKTNKKGEPYVLVKFLNFDDGEVMDLATKDMTIANKIKARNKYLVDIQFANKGKFGWQPSISHIGECIGEL